MSNTDPTEKIGGINSGAREGLAVPASYKSPAVLLINTVKSSSVIEERKNV
jgi:hypothetical protein